MAISREDKADVKGALGKAMANKVAKATRDSNGTPKLRAHTEKLRAAGKLPKRSTGMAPDSPFRNVTHVGKKQVRKPEPTQISKEYYGGKWQTVGFYEDKKGNVTIKPYKK